MRKIKSLLRDPDIQMADVAAALWSVHTTLYKHVGEQRQHCL
ncbi:recombinase family protein, partial [Gluconobacter sp. AC10]|nr:recombinase family protein [Gluconobacter aidae]